MEGCRDLRARAYQIFCPPHMHCGSLRTSAIRCLHSCARALACSTCFTDILLAVTSRLVIAVVSPDAAAMLSQTSALTLSWGIARPLFNATPRFD